MRLLTFDSQGAIIQVQTHPKEAPPPYAILSHTWAHDKSEIIFEDFVGENGTLKLTENAKKKDGYAKLDFCGQQAKKDNLQYFWVDTCCICKEPPGNPELSEAITSMYRWYFESKKCYVYLSDVSVHRQHLEANTVDLIELMRRKKWFERGWTLQELLAPPSVEFFSKEWTHISNKINLSGPIEELTGIPRRALVAKSFSPKDFTVKERMQWVYGRDTTKVEDKVYCLQGIFEVRMPPIYGEGEELALDRLSREVAFKTQLDMHDLKKELFNSGPTYARESNRNNRCESNERIDQKKILNSLKFEQMDSRRSTIDSEYRLPKTCSWLLKHETYIDWTDENKFKDHNGFLWIYGKPGAGKSTLLNFAYAEAQKKKARNEIVIAFFFNARGEELEKSTIGMYRSLLLQLFSKDSELQHLLHGFEHGSSKSWTLNSLCKLFLTVLENLGDRKVKCFIDALDEGDEKQIREMVERLRGVHEEEPSTSNRFHVCFASRYYPSIDIDNALRIRLEGEVGHREDLEKYIRKCLRASKLPASLEENIIARVEGRASGVFMWVKLVIDMLNDVIRRYSPDLHERLEETLMEIPETLSELFYRILTRDQKNMDELLSCLQWILFSKRPLKREEFFFAMASAKQIDQTMEQSRGTTEAGTPHKWMECDPERVSQEGMHEYVLNSSKGLAQLTKSNTTPTVQFIHESVKDFLLKEGGLKKLWPEQGDLVFSLGHDKLRRCCQVYLAADLTSLLSSLPGPRPDIESLQYTRERKAQSASSANLEDVRKHLSTKFPFLNYASRYAFHHAEAATAREQNAFLSGFPLTRWIDISNALEPFAIRRHTRNADFLYLLSEFGCPRLLSTWVSIQQVEYWKPQKERYGYPLIAAYANGHENVLRDIWQPLHTIEFIDIIIADPQFGFACEVQTDRGPLLWALINGHIGLARSILILVHENQLPTSSLRPQSLDWQYEGVVSLMSRLNQSQSLKADQAPKTRNCHDKTMRRSLLYSVRRGNTAVARLLLDNEMDVDTLSGRKKRTLLIEAVKLSKIDSVKLLIEYGANIEASDADEYTPLMHTDFSREVLMIELLLQNGADPNTSGGKPLLLAIKGGRERIISLLLRYRAKIEGQHVKVALFSENIDTLQILLQDEGFPETLQAENSGHDRRLTRDRHSMSEPSRLLGGNELHVAANEDRTDTIKALFAQRRDVIDSVDLLGRTPLHVAALSNSFSAVLLLYKLGVNVNAQDSEGRTPVLCAMATNQFASSTLLVALGADLKISDYSGYTPLMATVQHRDYNYGFFYNIMRRSGDLAYGDLNARTNWKSGGQTALSFAILRGNKSYIRCLRQFGQLCVEGVRFNGGDDHGDKVDGTEAGKSDGLEDDTDDTAEKAVEYREDEKGETEDEYEEGDLGEN